MKAKDRKQHKHKWNLPAYIILNKKLYKVISKTKATDRAVLWNYEDNRREVHSYAAVAQVGEQAYSFYHIGQMLNRSTRTLRDSCPNFPKPYTIYSTTTGKPHGKRWDADGVMAIRDYYASRHFGRPRKDGEIVPINLPSRHELRALLNQETIHYVQTKEGEFVPTWKAHEF